MTDPSTMDSEATVFALYLLMPDAIWNKDMERGIDIADENVLSKLARKYRVPIAAVAIRYHYWALDREAGLA